MSKPDSYACPNILTHLLKHRLAALSRASKLVKMLEMKSGDTFSPNGAICDVWSTVTGRGYWSGNMFQYCTTSGSLAFANYQAPLNVVNDFFKLGIMNCAISKFFTLNNTNDPQDFLDFFAKVEDFPQLKIEALSKEVNSVWKIGGQCIVDNVIVGYLSDLRVIAPTLEDAQEKFIKENPQYKITSTRFVGYA